MSFTMRLKSMIWGDQSEGPSFDQTSHFFLPNATGSSRSYWLQGVSASPLLDHRTTAEIPSRAEVVIIGSGMSGSLTAYELLHSSNPPKSVVVLEAREMCSGATGRNAGHCKPDQYRGFRKYSKAFGADKAKQLLDDEQRNFLRMTGIAKEQSVNCDLWVGDTLDVAVTNERAEILIANYNEWKAFGGEISHVECITDPAEAEKVSRIVGAKCCLRWKAGSFYPWKFVAHLIEKSLEKGLNLQTWTPVTSVTPARSGQWHVNTSRGVITASTVVYATNAYSGSLLADFGRIVIKPTPFICTKVVPPRSHTGSHALKNTYFVTGYKDSSVTINPRSNSDGVILFGGESTAQDELEKYIEEHAPSGEINDSLGNFKPIIEGIQDFARGVLAEWEDEGVVGAGHADYNWSGIMGMSVDGMPYVGAVPGKKGQWILAGFSGHGMARIFTAAPGLVKLIQGGSWADTNLPDPFAITEERMRLVNSGELSAKPVRLL